MSEEKYSLKVGDTYENTINNSIGEIVKIEDGIVTFYCYEKTSGFLHLVTEPVMEGNFRNHDLDFIIKKYIETGIFNKIQKV